MKYYGEKDIKRGIKVGEVRAKDFDDDKTAIGFIKENGMIGAYISRLNGREEIPIDTSDVGMKCVIYNGDKYWYGENSYDCLQKLNRYIGFYKELPDIYDDKMFHWKVNKKYDSKECIIEDGVFEYWVIYKANGTASVDVRYVKCDNRHRNKVTIATIEVVYATNNVIVDAIKEWKRKFKEEIL